MSFFEIWWNKSLTIFIYIIFVTVSFSLSSFLIGDMRHEYYTYSYLLKKITHKPSSEIFLHKMIKYKIISCMLSVQYLQRKMWSLRIKKKKMEKLSVTLSYVSFANQTKPYVLRNLLITMWSWNFPKSICGPPSTFPCLQSLMQLSSHECKLLS